MRLYFNTGRSMSNIYIFEETSGAMCIISKHVLSVSLQSISNNKIQLNRHFQDVTINSSVLLKRVGGFSIFFYYYFYSARCPIYHVLFKELICLDRHCKYLFWTWRFVSCNFFHVLRAIEVMASLNSPHHFNQDHWNTGNVTDAMSLHNS